jgi:hypothetical protein
MLIFLTKLAYTGFDLIMMQLYRMSVYCSYRSLSDIHNNMRFLSVSVEIRRIVAEHPS